MGDGRLTIGVDVGGSNLRIALVGRDGSLGERRSERISRDADAAVARIGVLCRELDSTSVTGVEIGIPGRVDGPRRRVLSGGYIDFAAARLVELIEDAMGVPVSIGNDCNMALVAEMAVGAARSLLNVVMFTIGASIGGTIALEGVIVRGAGTAGQLGHISVAEDGAPCHCGRAACVDTTSSGSALERHIREAGFPVRTRFEDLEAAATAGDARATGVLLRWATPLRSHRRHGGGSLPRRRPARGRIGQSGRRGVGPRTRGLALVPMPGQGSSPRRRLRRHRIGPDGRAAERRGRIVGCGGLTR